VKFLIVLFLIIETAMAVTIEGDYSDYQVNEQLSGRMERSKFDVTGSMKEIPLTSCSKFEQDIKKALRPFNNCPSCGHSNLHYFIDPIRFGEKYYPKNDDDILQIWSFWVGEKRLENDQAYRVNNLEIESDLDSYTEKLKSFLADDYVSRIKHSEGDLISGDRAFTCDLISKKINVKLHLTRRYHFEDKVSDEHAVLVSQLSKKLSQLLVAKKGNNLLKAALIGHELGKFIDHHPEVLSFKDSFSTLFEKLTYEKDLKLEAKVFSNWRELKKSIYPVKTIEKDIEQIWTHNGEVYDEDY
jgi:hypothetical protein